MGDDLEGLLEFLGIGQQPEPEPILSCHTDDPLEAFLPPPAPKVVECAVPTQPIQEAQLRTYYPFGLSDIEEATMFLDLIRQLFANGPFSLTEVRRQADTFEGDGVYALYYHGGFPLYSPVRSAGSTYPLYVGKSDRPGRTRGGPSSARNLYSRLVHDHYTSIEQATNLSLEHFTFRFLRLAPSWVDFVERGLVRLFQPVWNVLISGFGARHFANDDRRNPIERASVWDSLHPGRKAAGKNPRPLEDIEQIWVDGFPACLKAYEEVMQSVRYIA
jgi:Eco29kI restriction endonuclease